MALLEMLLPSAVTAAVGFLGSERTNRSSERLSKEQMEFQERMSSTAYQRAVADMQTAGLNPMLAYSQGGASSPVGSMPQVKDSVASGMSSAVEAAQVMQALQSVQQSAAQVDNLKATTEKIKSETLANELHTAKAVNELSLGDVKYERDVQAWVREKLMAPELVTSARAQARRDKVEADKAEGTFDADVRRRKAEATLAELGIPVREADAKFFEKMEDAPQILKFMLQLVRGVTGAR